MQNGWVRVYYQPILRTGTEKITILEALARWVDPVRGVISPGSGGMFLELDIDRFKAINDSFGHQTGDLVIMAVADALRGTFRTNDVTMRLGGDEFGAFALGIVDQAMGEAIIRRLFRRLENLDIPELNGEKVCISVGAVLVPAEGKLSFHDMYALADDAMYASKKISGNSLSFAQAEAAASPVS